MRKSFRLCFLLLALLPVPFAYSDAPEKWNLLIVTVDDMSCDSVGFYGCLLPETPPTWIRLASEGIRFNHAFVQGALR